MMSKLSKQARGKVEKWVAFLRNPGEGFIQTHGNWGQSNKCGCAIGGFVWSLFNNNVPGLIGKGSLMPLSPSSSTFKTLACHIGIPAEVLKFANDAFEGNQCNYPTTYRADFDQVADLLEAKYLKEV